MLIITQINAYPVIGFAAEEQKKRLCLMPDCGEIILLSTPKPTSFCKKDLGKRFVIYRSEYDHPSPPKLRDIIIWRNEPSPSHKENVKTSKP